MKNKEEGCAYASAIITMVVVAATAIILIAAIIFKI
jgi:hypothetical protein